MWLIYIIWSFVAYFKDGFDPDDFDSDYDNEPLWAIFVGYLALIPY